MNAAGDLRANRSRGHANAERQQQRDEQSVALMATTEDLEWNWCRHDAVSHMPRDAQAGLFARKAHEASTYAKMSGCGLCSVEDD